MTNKPIINSTTAVLLAKATIAWWEEQADAALARSLFLKEPPFVQQARAVLNETQGRIRLSVQPKEKSK